MLAFHKQHALPLSAPRHTYAINYSTEQQEPSPSSPSSRLVSLFLPGRRIDASLHVRQELLHQLCFFFVAGGCSGYFWLLISSYAYCRLGCSSPLWVRHPSMILSAPETPLAFSNDYCKLLEARAPHLSVTLVFHCCGLCQQTLCKFKGKAFSHPDTTKDKH